MSCVAQKTCGRVYQVLRGDTMPDLCTDEYTR